MSTLEFESVEDEVKIIIVGNGGVGKSTLLCQFCEEFFCGVYRQTVGSDYREKRLQIYGKEILLYLWDTAGQEKYDAVSRSYYRGASGCVLMFSTVDEESFYCVEKWQKKVEEECGKIPTVLVQNKIDLLDQSVISPEDAEQLSRKLGVKFFRVSVKTNFGVKDVFFELALQYLRHRKRLNTKDPLTSIDMGTIEEHSNFIIHHHDDDDVDVDDHNKNSEDDDDFDDDFDEFLDDEGGLVRPENENENEKEKKEKKKSKKSRIKKERGKEKKENKYLDDDDDDDDDDEEEVKPIRQRTGGKKKAIERACKYA